MTDPTLHHLTAGHVYAVTPAADCTVTTSNGTVIITVQAGAQACFVAPEPTIYTSDPACRITETFKGASVAVSGGGGKITVDREFSPTSSNAQSGCAVRQAIAGIGTCITDYGVLGETHDLSGYTINCNGRVAPTDEIWFESGDTATEITWPESWIWLEGEAPALTTNTAYRVTVRQESGERIVANVAYAYPIPITTAGEEDAASNLSL